MTYYSEHFSEFEREKAQRLGERMAVSLERMKERVAKWKAEHPGEAYPFLGSNGIPSERHTRQGHWV